MEVQKQRPRQGGQTDQPRESRNAVQRMRRRRTICASQPCYGHACCRLMALELKFLPVRSVVVHSIAHAGDPEGARKLARQNLQAFGSSGEPIITNAGGCGAMLVAYGHPRCTTMRHTNSAPEFATSVNNSPLNSNAEAQTLTMVERPTILRATCCTDKRPGMLR